MRLVASFAVFIFFQALVLLLLGAVISAKSRRYRKESKDVEPSIICSHSKKAIFSEVIAQICIVVGMIVLVEFVQLHITREFVLRFAGEHEAACRAAMSLSLAVVIASPVILVIEQVFHQIVLNAKMKELAWKVDLSLFPFGVIILFLAAGSSIRNFFTGRGLSFAKDQLWLEPFSTILYFQFRRLVPDRPIYIGAAIKTLCVGALTSCFFVSKELLSTTYLGWDGLRYFTLAASPYMISTTFVAMLVAFSVRTIPPRMDPPWEPLPATQPGQS